MSKVTQEDVEIFANSNVSQESKEITAKNINKGRSLEDAFDSPYGKILTKDVDAVLMESLGKIMQFKHDPEKSIEQNYDNIRELLLEHSTALKVKSRWEAILRTKESSLNKIGHISSQIKQGRNGG